MRGEAGDRFRPEPLLPPILLVELGQEQRRQPGNLFPPLAQRGHPDLHHVEPVVEIRPELPARHRLLEVPVGGGDHADVDVDHTVAPDARESEVLQYVEELGLQGERQFRDLVQVDRALVRELELAGLAAVGAGERPLFVSEELALHQPLGNRGTVDLDEWPLGAGRPGMDGPGDAVFAHPAFAAEQDRRIRVRDVLDDREDGPHPRASVVKWDVAPEIRLWDGAHELFVRERRSQYSFADQYVLGVPEANNPGNPLNHAMWNP